MKSIKKTGIFTIVIFMFSACMLFTCGNKTYAQDITIKLNGTELQTGYYVPLAGGGYTWQADQPDDSSDYFRYDSSKAEITVHEYMTVSYGNGVDGLTVDNGTLTINGSGTLYFVCSDTSSTGVSYALKSTTEGSVNVSGFGGNVNISSTMPVCSGLDELSIIATGTVQIETTYDSDNYSTFAANTVGLSSGTETIINVSGKLAFDCDNLNIGGKECDVECEGELVNGSLSVIVDDDADIVAGSLVSGNMVVIECQNLNLKSVSGSVCSGKADITGNDVRIWSYDNTFADDARITADVCAVISSDKGTVAMKNLDVTVEDGDAYIDSELVSVAGNLKVNADGVLAISNSTHVCGGDAEINTFSAYIEGSGDNPLVLGTLKLKKYSKVYVHRDNPSENLDRNPVLKEIPEQALVYVSDVTKVAIYFDGDTYEWPDTACSADHLLCNAAGLCLQCDEYDIDIVKVISADGTTETTYRYLTDALSAMKEGDTLRLLTNIVEGADSEMISVDKGIIIDLNGYRLINCNIDIMGNLTIKNGFFYGSISNGNINNVNRLILSDMSGEFTGIMWGATEGIELIDSSIIFEGDCVWTEKLAMSEKSIFEIKADSSAIGNYGHNHGLEEALGGIREFLPHGYGIKKLTESTDKSNIIVDDEGNPAKNVLLKYKRLTDPEADVKLTVEEHIYDGTEKSAVITVTYNGIVLTKDRDYKLTYNNNVNAGTATVTITGAGIYHDSVSRTFIIGKAERMAPEGLNAGNASLAGSRDGYISGVTDEMEYSTDKVNWTAVTGNIINGLEAGDYYVRYAESVNYKASSSVKLTVETGGDVAAGDEYVLPTVIAFIVLAAGTAVLIYGRNSGKAENN